MCPCVLVAREMPRFTCEVFIVMLLCPQFKKGTEPVFSGALKRAIEIKNPDMTGHFHVGFSFDHRFSLCSSVDLIGRIGKAPFMFFLNSITLFVCLPFRIGEAKAEIKILSIGGGAGMNNTCKI